MMSLYPKEWLVTETSQDVLLPYDLADLNSLEPWWKLILGNKALLPLLWSMYPNHPALLPAYYGDPASEMDYNRMKSYEGIGQELDKYWVSKPIFGREGAGVFRSNNFTTYE